MKITILVENQTSRTKNKLCASEWGFSAFIQTGETSILFDTGHSGIYWRNAKNLGLNLEDTQFVILSHRHKDHAKGLLYHEFKTKKKLVIHPDILEKAEKEVTAVIKKDFEIVLSKEPLEIIPNFYFLGEIPRIVSYEKGVYENEKMFDDTALAVKTKKGAVIITGCSHSGISNICERAKQVTGQDLYAVIGGFHLFEDDPKAVEGAIEYFKKENLQHLYPMHCVDFPTMVKFYNEFGVKKLGVGDVIEFEG